MKKIMLANDVVWVITAIICIIHTNPITEAIVFGTTMIYVIDLLVKLRSMHFRLFRFLRANWLDIVFLLPIVDVFKGIRIIKAGRILRYADTTIELVNIARTVKGRVNK